MKPIFIKDLGMRKPKPTSKFKSRYWAVKCPSCDKEFEAIASSIKSGNTTQCRSCASTKHGMSRDRLYNIWADMKYRCENENNPDYIRYGAKGITVTKHWSEDFNAFKEWALANGYEEDLTIDRINGRIGYSEDNCRWASRSVQAQNTAKLSSRNTSGYRGVTSSYGGKWKARIVVNKKIIHLGIFVEKTEAAKAYEAYVIENNLEHTINFEKETK